eukprot:747425-Alexandrium_andersonii.AAC.1
MSGTVLSLARPRHRWQAQSTIARQAPRLGSSLPCSAPLPGLSHSSRSLSRLLPHRARRQSLAPRLNRTSPTAPSMPGLLLQTPAQPS